MLRIYLSSDDRGNKVSTKFSNLLKISSIEVIVVYRS